MAREPESGLLETIQGTTDWGILLLLRVVVCLPLVFFGVLHLVFSTPDHAYDLNIYNSASTEKTLGFMVLVAIVGVPIVLTYTITVYYNFRGKVLLTEESY
jgi:cytochrome d ubiquinol oxidase subunit II